VKAIEIRSDTHGEVINTGTSAGISIRDIFEKIKGLIGHEPRNVRWNSVSKRPFEIHKLTMSIDKAEKLLGWRPKISLDEGLKRTVEWWTQIMKTKNPAYA
jgi:nucleoside-diphosphate-sugar epimerase